MKSEQWKSAEEIREIQERKLSALAAHARATVPRYSGMPNIRSLEGLRTLPIIRKADVQSSPSSFLSSSFPRESLEIQRTSGSTGTQLELFRHPSEQVHGVAMECHHFTECGVGPLDSRVRITHYSIPPSAIQRLGLFRSLYLPVLEEPAVLLGKLARMRAPALLSYPSILVPLAKLNAPSPRYSPKRVFSTGELLSASAKKAISSSFGCPVHDLYGASETSWVAWECEKGSLHLHAGSVVAEIVDDSGAPVPHGAEGSLVLTPLWARAMPLIRYSVGDRMAFGGKCPCGRGLPVLKPCEGRQDDFITLPSGRLRSPRCINLMDDITGILSYQIVQEEPDRFVFRFVPAAGGFPDRMRKEAARRISDGCLGEPVRVEFEEVPSMQRSGRGKLRAVISGVKPNAGT